MEDRLEEALADVLLRQEAGEDVSDAWIREHHPDCADQVLDALRTRKLLGVSRPVGAGFSVGDFEVLEEIGRGSMGVVCRARQKSLRRIVALKILSPAHLGDPRARMRFRREAVAASRIEHPNLVPLFEFGEEDDILYIAMEYVEGISLAAHIKAEQEKGLGSLLDAGQETLTDMIRRFADLADALHLAHEGGLLHRDVKPANILLSKDGRLRLTDFGLARCGDSTRLTRTGETLGTPLYMSPEQIEDATRIDGRSDVYSLGMTLYETLTLRAPFSWSSWPEAVKKVLDEDPPRPRALGLDIGKELEAIVMKAIEKDPDRRFATARDLAEDLRAFTEGQPVSARPPNPLSHLRRFIARHRIAVRAAVVAAVLALLAALGPGVWREVEEKLEDRAARRAQQEREETAADLLSRTRNTGPADERVRLLKRLVTEFPGTSSVPEAWRLLGGAYEELGAWEEAEEAWLAALYSDLDGATGTAALLDLARHFYRLGRLDIAADLAKEALSRTETGPPLARSLLNLAEIEAGRGKPSEGQAFWYLARCEEEKELLPPGLRRRLTRLTATVESLLPARHFDAPSLAQAIVARLDEKTPSLILLFEGSVACYRLEGGALVPRELPGLPSYGFLRSALAVDLTSDGQDELVIVSAEDINAAEYELAIFELEGGEFRRRFETSVPNGEYNLGAGDADGDGVVDVLVPSSYPARDARVLRNRTGFSFDWAPQGDLSEIGPDTDVAAMSAGDLDGDGVPELVVATMAYKLFSLLIYRFDRESGGFLRVHDELVGFVAGCPVADLDGDGLPEVVFATSSHNYTAAVARFGEFMPQGIFVLDHGASDFETRTVEAFRRLRAAPPVENMTSPLNVTFGSPVVGRAASMGCYLAAPAMWGRGHSMVAPRVRAYPFAEGPGVLVSPMHTVFSPIGVGDLDADGDDELLFRLQDGLTILGLPGPRRAVEPKPFRPLLARDLPDAKRILAFAQRLRQLELFRIAYRTFETVRERYPESPEAKEALLVLVDIHAVLWETDLALDRLDQFDREYPEDRIRTVFLRAGLLERRGELEQAAEEYDRAAKLGDMFQTEREIARARAAELAGWRNSREIRVSPPDGWVAKQPGNFRFRADGGIDASEARGSRTQASIPIRWNGGSIQIEFDLVIEAFGMGQSYMVGLVADTRLRGFDGGFYLTGSCTTSGPSSAALMVIAPAADGQGEIYGPMLRTSLPFGVRLSCLLTYLPESRRAGVIMRRGRELLANRLIERFPELIDLPSRIALGCPDIKHQTEVRFSISGLRLRVPEGTEFEIVEEPSLYLRANGALARGDDAEATRLYRRFLDTPGEGTPGQRALARVVRAILDWRAEPGEERRARVNEAAQASGGTLAEILEDREFLVTAEERKALLGE